MPDMLQEEDDLLTVAEATAMLPDGERVHVFTRTMIGADWKRENVLKALESAKVRMLAGPIAVAMKHGLYVLDDTNSEWLMATIPDHESRLKALRMASAS